MYVCKIDYSSSLQYKAISILVNKYGKIAKTNRSQKKFDPKADKASELRRLLNIEWVNFEGSRETKVGGTSGHRTLDEHVRLGIRSLSCTRSQPLEPWA